MLVNSRTARNLKAMRSVSHFISKHFVGTFVALASCIVVAGCGASGPYILADDAPATLFKPSPGLAIGRGDVIGVRVFGQEPLSIRSTVRPDGMIAMPLIGDVAVSGKHPGTVAKEIEARLVPYVTTPNVVVAIEESRIRIVALGELRRNGTIALEPGESGLFDAIANAGGLTEFASWSRIFVIRTEATGVFRIRFSYDDISRGIGRAATFRLQTGDQLVAE